LAQPRKSDEEYPGYLEDQNRKVNQKQCSFCGRETVQFVCGGCHKASIKIVNDRLETLEVRFNELCGLLHTQLANSSFLLLKIDEAEK